MAPKSPPKKPIPSADSGVIPSIAELHLSDDTSLPAPDALDVSSVDALVALRILSRSITALAELTGDVPATPPALPSRPSTPGAMRNVSGTMPSSRPGTPPSRVPNEDLLQPGFRRVSMGSPEAEPGEPVGGGRAATPPPVPTITLEERVARAQYNDALARKFFSKKPPAISVADYLLRLHRYCPMSSAVYLAAGCYLHRMALEDCSVPVTPRTVHRLLIGTLRVAMKALEDLSYPHRRFAGVGGISERELAKLEITVCYLMEFELRVDEEQMADKARSLIQLANGLQEGMGGGGLGKHVAMRLKLPRARSSDLYGRRMTVH